MNRALAVRICEIASRAPMPTSKRFIALLQHQRDNCKVHSPPSSLKNCSDARAARVTMFLQFESSELHNLTRPAISLSSQQNLSSQWRITKCVSSSRRVSEHQ